MPRRGKGIELVVGALAAAVAIGGCNSPPCGVSGNACCGAGVCNRPLVCIAGTCGANTATPAKSQADICQQLAEGQARRDALNQLAAQVPLLSAAASPSCDSTLDQRIAVQTLQQQLVGAAVSPLRSPDCNDPQSQLYQRAVRIAVGLDAGRIVWNEPADTECQAGMAASSYLTTAVLSADGGFPGEDQIFGTSGKAGSAPCDELLQGQLALGDSCQEQTECQPGLYCRPSSATSCGGTCAVADGGCGPLDLCPGVGLPFVSLGSGLKGALTIGSPCDAGAGCGPCLSCLGNKCAASPGGLGSACPGQACLAPFLYCGDAGTCVSTVLLGEPCEATGGGCLQGTCLGSPPTCRPPGGIGDPCDPTSSGCDAGVCAPASGGNSTCQPAPDAGQPCLAAQCGPGDVCDPDSSICAPPRGGGAACARDAQCQSGLCLVPDGGIADAGLCLSPCIQPPDSGCLNLYSNSSFLLGLGGALVLGRRRRAARRDRHS